MRILGLDLGSKTCGVAVSDDLGLTAQGVEVIRRKDENKYRRTLSRIEELIAEYDIEKIVLGYPKNMNDTVSRRCEISAEFAEKLKKRTGIPVVLWDERLTTVAAHDVMLEAGLSREEREKIVDKVAATFILEDYLNEINDYKRKKEN